MNDVSEDRAEAAQPTGPNSPLPADPKVVSDFWSRARGQVGWAQLEFIVGQQQSALIEPPWMQLSEDPEEATKLAVLLAEQGRGSIETDLGTYPEGAADIPKVGELTIICDGEGRPQALVMTTGVEIVDHGDASIVEEKLRTLYPRQKRTN